MLFGSDPNFSIIRLRSSLDGSQGIFPPQHYLCYCDILSLREECVIKSAVTNHVYGDRDDTYAESTSSSGHRSLMFLPIYTAVIVEASHTVPSATWANFYHWNFSWLPQSCYKSPCDQKLNLPGLVRGASGVVVVLGLGRGRRVCFDVLGAEERKSLIITKSVVQKLCRQWCQIW